MAVDQHDMILIHILLRSIQWQNSPENNESHNDDRNFMDDSNSSKLIDKDDKAKDNHNTNFSQLMTIQ